MGRIHFCASTRRHIKIGFLVATFLVFLIAVPQQAKGSASITISSVTLASDGKTLTATISGGTGTGYGPSSGVTGLTVKNTTDGNTYNNASATISGTTLTITVTGYLPAGKTVTLDLASGSNLTDSGSNTAQGQTAVSVTNNSALTATNWNHNNAGISAPFQGTSGLGSGIRFVFIETVLSGTDANLSLQEWGSGNVYASVDGGAETLIGTYGNTGTKRVFPLYSGLSSGSHDVSVRITGQATTVDPLIQTTSATPPSLPARSGPSYPIIANYIATDNTNPTVNGSSLQFGHSGIFIRFRATITSVRVEAYYVSGSANGITLDLMRRASGSLGPWSDVGTLASNIFGTENNFKISSSITGLDGSQEWEYALVVSADSPSAAGGTYWVGGIAVTGTGLNTTPLTSQKSLILIGDSETVSYANTKWHNSWNYQIQRDLGISVLTQGVAGEHVTGGMDVRSASFSNISTQRGVVFYGASVNDNVNESGGPANTFKASANTVLTNAWGAWPNMPGIIAGIAPELTNTTHPVTDAAWRQANIDTGSHYAFYSSTGVVNTLSDPTAGADHLAVAVDGSGIHLNPSGSTKTAAFIENRLIPAIAATGVTVSGPPSGTFGQPSTNFTVTIASGATFTGDQTVTISDGSNGGTFAPSVGSPGVNSVTVTPVNGGTFFTFMYTPASSGTKTLTFTNGQGWADPSAATYMAASPDTTAPIVSLTAPATGSTVHGTSVSLAATASDDTAVSGVQFKLDTNTNIGAEDTTSAYAVTWDSTAVPDGSHTIIAVARDAAGNYATSTAVTVTVDNTAPVRSAGAPTGTLAAGTSATTISLTTNESATCKYSANPGTAYGSMTSFDTTGGTSQSSSVSGLSNGSNYIYYVKCQDGQGNVDGGDYTISFSIATVVQSSSGGSSGGGGGGYVSSPLPAPVLPGTIPSAGCSPDFLFNIYTGTACTTSSTPSLPIPPSTPAKFLAPPFAHDLDLGSAGLDVYNLQEYLNAHGFIVSRSGNGSPGHETTYFGPATQTALIHFQKTHHISPAAGYFGPITRRVVNGN